MIFWDTSAVVPLIVPERPSAECARLLRSDESMVVWGVTPVEAYSALQRRFREGKLAERTRLRAVRRLGLLKEAWAEVRDLDIVARRAERLLNLHPLRAADALQLAAALVVSEERPERLPFACLDAPLAAAARLEGFTVLPSGR